MRVVNFLGVFPREILRCTFVAFFFSFHLATFVTTLLYYNSQSVLRSSLLFAVSTLQNVGELNPIDLKALHDDKNCVR